MRALVVIPSFDTGTRLAATVRDALAAWPTVWVVIDGSRDGSERALATMKQPGLRAFHLAVNQGKGGAIRHALVAAVAEGFTHVLTLDADGQHLATDIPVMMGIATRSPEAMVLGTPIFDSSAPRERVFFRRISNVLANLCAGGCIGDALYGMRVYPIAPLMAAFDSTRFMRRYDFDAEAAIRLFRAGVPAINMPTPVRYFAKDDGGISHFSYLRDNLRLGFMFTRLLLRR